MGCALAVVATRGFARVLLQKGAPTAKLNYKSPLPQKKSLKLIAKNA